MLINDLGSHYLNKSTYFSARLGIMKEQNKLSALARNPKIHGVIQIGLSTYWLLVFVDLWYGYYFTERLYFMMYSIKTHTLLTLLSCIGIYVGFKVVRSKITIKRGYLLLSFLWILGVVIFVLVYL